MKRSGECSLELPELLSCEVCFCFRSQNPQLPDPEPRESAWAFELELKLRD
jgi:hypothetical protein